MFVSTELQKDSTTLRRLTQNQTKLTKLQSEEVLVEVKNTENIKAETIKAPPSSTSKPSAAGCEPLEVTTERTSERTTVKYPPLPTIAGVLPLVSDNHQGKINLTLSAILIGRQVLNRDSIGS